MGRKSNSALPRNLGRKCSTLNNARCVLTHWHGKLKQEYEWNWIPCGSHHYPETLTHCPICNGVRDYDLPKIKRGILALLREAQIQGLTVDFFYERLGGVEGPKVPKQVILKCLRELSARGEVEKLAYQEPDLGSSDEEFSLYSWRLR